MLVNNAGKVEVHGGYFIFLNTGDSVTTSEESALQCYILPDVDLADFLSSFFLKIM